jgi:hypothetical protein
MIICYIVDSFEILQVFYEHWTCLIKIYIVNLKKWLYKFFFYPNEEHLRSIHIWSKLVLNQFLFIEIYILFKHVILTKTKNIEVESLLPRNVK